ncbi:unnamed protein product, partial [Discosporangium mesarthrocarpum]
MDPAVGAEVESILKGGHTVFEDLSWSDAPGRLVCVEIGEEKVRVLRVAEGSSAPPSTEAALPTSESMSTSQSQDVKTPSAPDGSMGGRGNDTDPGPALGDGGEALSQSKVVEAD